MFYLRMSWERSENRLTHDQFSFEQKKTIIKAAFNTESYTKNLDKVVE